MKENLLNTKKELINKLKQAEDELVTLKQNIKNNESDLWLNTNFNELGYTNKETRKSYVNKCIKDLKLNESLKRNEVNHLKRELTLCDNKIKLLS